MRPNSLTGDLQPVKKQFGSPSLVQRYHEYHNLDSENLSCDRMTAMFGNWTALESNWRRLAHPSGIRRGGLKGLNINIVVIGTVGVATPWRKGFDIFDPFIVFAYALIPLLYVIPAISDLLGGSSGLDMEGVQAKAVASAAYSWGFLMIIYVLSIVTVNILYRLRFLHPAWGLAASAALFGFAVALLAAAATALLAVLFSPPAARSAMRLTVLGLLLIFLQSGRWMPQSWQIWMARQYTASGLIRFGLIASAVMLVASAGLLYALRARRESY